MTEHLNSKFDDPEMCFRSVNFSHQFVIDQRLEFVYSNMVAVAHLRLFLIEFVVGRQLNREDEIAN
jgi:hypothetical protein